jgi:hypothetical protein
LAAERVIGLGTVPEIEQALIDAIQQAIDKLCGPGGILETAGPDDDTTEH